MSNTTGYDGIGEVIATFRAYDGVKVGDLVSLKSNNMVEKAAIDTEIMGVCVHMNGSYASVQMKGGVTVACSDAALSLGYRMLKAAAGNSVKSATTGMPHLVISVDSDAKTATVIL